MVICVLAVAGAALAAGRVYSLKAVHKMAGGRTGYESVTFDKWRIFVNKAISPDGKTHYRFKNGKWTHPRK